MAAVAPNVQPILPPAWLGVLGGGQLGRFFVIAARNMGYRVAVLDPHRDSPAGALAERHLAAEYEDRAALDELARLCQAVTTEFENVPAASLAHLAARTRVAPSAQCVAVAQDRIAEKAALLAHGFPVAPYAPITGEQDFGRLREFPAILKTARLGYDGKGQVDVARAADLAGAWQALGRVPCVLERRLALERELSVIVARGPDGESRAFAVAENRHRHGILDVSIVPARIDAALTERAREMARRLVGALGYVGVLGVEFFVVAGELYVNEIAPRPHNSGHYTLDACVTSQYAQQVRALCGLPLGDERLLSPATMVNVLGDAWRGGEPPPWQAVLAEPRAKLYLYGKAEARPGRKMAHFTVLDASPERALSVALELRARLGIGEA
ncbi:MAG TPA: 5-(carboxyamino)imidazole ribonucleotide synthase [Burkholderiales bacterium]|nr:5-(carboxyamino)imidazole ribonucleotide synthase [Burkholderiales bacterium]